jgi:hypothetical protein
VNAPFTPLAVLVITALKQCFACRMSCLNCVVIAVVVPGMALILCGQQKGRLAGGRVRRDWGEDQAAAGVST